MTVVNFRDLRYSPEEDAYIYEDDPFTGVARTNPPPGEIVGETSYVDGLLEGPTRYFYPSGELLGEDHYLRGSMHGPSREWYRDGTPKRDALYEHSILVRDKKWDEGGALVEDFQLTEADPLFHTLQHFRKTYGGPPSAP